MSLRFEFSKVIPKATEYMIQHMLIDMKILIMLLNCMYSYIYISDC